MSPARIVPRPLEEGWRDGWPPATPVGVFLHAVRQGNTPDVAAHTAGLNPADVAHWETVGRALLAGHHNQATKVPLGRRAFAAFTQAVARAQADAEERMVAVIRTAAEADTKDAWRAAAWLLARQPKTTIELEETDDDDDEIQRLAAPVSTPLRHPEN